MSVANRAAAGYFIPVRRGSGFGMSVTAHADPFAPQIIYSSTAKNALSSRRLSEKQITQVAIASWFRMLYHADLA